MGNIFTEYQRSISPALSLIAVVVGMITYRFAFSDANADSHDSVGEVRVATRSRHPAQRTFGNPSDL